MVERSVAESEFNRFCDAMDLDINPDYMSREDKEGLDKQKRVIVDAIHAGRVVVEENGEPVFTPADGEPLHFL